MKIRRETLSMDIEKLEQSIKQELIDIEKNEGFLDTCKEARDKYATQQKEIFAALPADLKQAITHRKKMGNAGKATIVLAVLVVLATAVFYFLSQESWKEIAAIAGVAVAIIIFIAALVRRSRGKKIMSALSKSLNDYDAEQLSLEKEINALLSKEKEIRDEIAVSNHRVDEWQKEITRLQKYSNSIIVFFKGDVSKCEIYIDEESHGDLSGEKTYKVGSGIHNIKAEGVLTGETNQTFQTNTLQVNLSDTYACLYITPTGIKELDVIEYNKIAHKGDKQNSI